MATNPVTLAPTPPPPPKRLAITIAGAVSLGSYEAGVLYEVLDAIHHHNTHPDTLADPGSRIVIDVLTGASAGGMTAIILAQKLLFSASEFINAYNNPLYNVWVKRIDLAGLQQTGPNEQALHSLFSSDLIETISHEMLLSRYNNSPPPPASRHAAVEDTLRIGVALTNLNGIDYEYDVEPDDKFVYRQYSDQLTRTIDQSSDNPAFWEPLRQAAVACGAFPIAFRARPMDRTLKGPDKEDFATHLAAWKSDPFTFTYTDGGILQNQPLGMAKNLVDLVPGHLDQERRFYLFVSPHAKDAGGVNEFSEHIADYRHMVARLIKAVIGQSGFRDWIQATEINKRVHLLDERASGLKDAMLATPPGIAVADLQNTATALLNLFFPPPDQTHLSPGARHEESLTAAQTRISHQYKKEIDALTTAQTSKAALAGAALAFRDAILAFETAAGLGARDEMAIYGITATESQLAGAGLQAFLGFFDKKYREHDYNVGRQHARDFLMKTLLDKAGVAQPYLSQPDEIGPLRGLDKLQVIRPIPQSFNGLRLSHVFPADLDLFKRGMKTRVNQMIDERNPGSWFRAPAIKLAIDPLLDIALNWLIHME